MNITILSANDFSSNMKVWDNYLYNVNRDNGRMVFDDFHYWCKNDIYDCLEYENTFFIIAYEDSFVPANIIGVLKYGVYGYEEKHIGICYVDVRSDKKRQGVGTKLLETFNKHDFDSYVSVSFFSDECLQTNFFKTVFAVLDNHTCLWSHRGYTFPHDRNFYDIDKTTVIENPWM